jgi:hypothetical protein
MLKDRRVLLEQEMIKQKQACGQQNLRQHENEVSWYDDWTYDRKSNAGWRTSIMANKKQGNLTAPPQWWKHLRDWKRIFWKSERNAQKKDIKDRIKEWTC